ncbi:hotdog fold thioesterase [Morganella psychrotolerans]|uniref:Thioesterase n=1 Tax=Morganella psychrotolerans TaxID=368603 RepID=A0A1B8HTS9_9GAMM|nr:hotdog fold thioesterase [Morganella psychrotolerans]OBU13287.1 thioesterase [Morganella psychrotolerans]
MIWKRATTLAELNQIAQGNMLSHLGIEFTALEPEQLIGTMPVDERTKQPHGLLHGGASVVLAESLGSVAGYLCSEGDETVVGVEINANHVRAVRGGRVTGHCKAIHLGRNQQVWSIEIYDEQQKLCCISRLTTAVLHGSKK